MGDDIGSAHPGHRPDGLRSIGAGELDHDLTIRRADVHVRRPVLAGREEDDDAKSAHPEDGRHLRNVT
jgi:hypothetical protein